MGLLSIVSLSDPNYLAFISLQLCVDKVKSLLLSQEIQFWAGDRVDLDLIMWFPPTLSPNCTLYAMILIYIFHRLLAQPNSSSMSIRRVREQRINGGEVNVNKETMTKKSNKVITNKNAVLTIQTFYSDSVSSWWELTHKTFSWTWAFLLLFNGHIDGPWQWLTVIAVVRFH